MDCDQHDSCPNSEARDNTSGDGGRGPSDTVYTQSTSERTSKPQEDTIDPAAQIR